jgi:glycosyltransferase involved in cell wall biosynthesis
LRNASATLGGIEGQVQRFAAALMQDRRLNPLVGTTDCDGAFAQRLVQDGIEVRGYRRLRSGRIELDSALRAKLRSGEIVAVQTYGVRESFVGRQLRWQYPVARHIFRVQTYIDCANIPTWRKYLYHEADRLTSSCVDAYVANGAYIAAELVQTARIRPDKVHVIVNGRAALGPCNCADEGLQPTVAMVANFVHGKGHDVLIRAMALLKNRQGLRVTARLIGGDPSGEDALGSARESCLTLARAEGVEGQLDFRGYSSDVYQAARDVPVWVLPSDSEGVPNVVLEGMSLGKLVIASRVGGVPELIEHGKTGFLHSHGDPEQLALLLLRVFRGGPASFINLRQAAYQRWKAHFTMSRMMEQFWELYGKLGILAR